MLVLPCKFPLGRSLHATTLPCRIADIDVNQQRDNDGQLRLDREIRADWGKISSLLRIPVVDNRSSGAEQGHFWFCIAKAQHSAVGFG